MHSTAHGGRPSTKGSVRSIHRLSAKKHLGQHFLIDTNVLTTIIQTAELASDEHVLEIGPGQGVLTSALADVVVNGLVLALEKDFDLLATLRERFKGRRNVKIVSGDILSVPLERLLETPYKVVANIPYRVTSPILTKFLLGDYRGRAGALSPRPETLTLMVQREVAERLVAQAGDRDRGILSVLIELFGSARIVQIVPPEAFRPAPLVQSAILHVRLTEPRANPVSFHRLLKFGFANRRRQLHNALAGSLDLASEETERLLKLAGINPLLRAEQLTFEQWLALHQVVLQTVTQ